jgi:hypothetical protein
MQKICSILCLLSLVSCAPSLVSFSEDENFIQVYEDLKGTQNEIYLKANDWMIKQFKDATSVIQHSDKEDGVIIGKYLMYGNLSSGMYGATSDSRVYAIIDIRVKDNKARLEIKPQAFKYDPSGMTIYYYSKADCIRDMKLMGESFYQALQKDAVKF